MEKSFRLSGELREKTGSIATAKLRKQKMLPAVVYGHGKDPMSFSFDEHTFIEAIHHGIRVMELEVNGKTETVLIKAFQYGPFGQEIIHVDFKRVDATERVTVFVGLNFKGVAKGAGEGGLVTFHKENIELECQVTNIPEQIVVSIKELELGQNLYAKDIELPAGAVLKTDDDTLLVTCSVIAEEVEAEEVEGTEAAQPEIIGRKAEEETESEEK
jgi:large subunit ribosomal protein L25